MLITFLKKLKQIFGNYKILTIWIMLLKKSEIFFKNFFQILNNLLTLY